MKFGDYAEIYGLFDRGYKNKEIARILGVDAATVSRSLSELKDKFPRLFPKRDSDSKPKVVPYTDLQDKYVKQQF